jgi:F-type H+-transporting ATPase subunit b
MQINWFTVIAQVVNFLILVWLLRRFLYKPILDAIDERENKITSQLNEAEVKRAEAIKAKGEFIQKNELFDQQKDERMNSVLNEVKDTKHKLLEEARNEANTLRKKLEATYKDMQESAHGEIAKMTQQEVFAIVRKTLADLSSVSLEEQSTLVFISKLKDLNEEERKQFIEAFNTEDPYILVQSTFDLHEQMQSDIVTILNEILGVEANIQFKTSPDLISGIELSTSGYKVAWSISEYLNSLENTIFNTTNKKSEVFDEHK